MNPLLDENDTTAKWMDDAMQGKHPPESNWRGHGGFSSFFSNLIQSAIATESFPPETLQTIGRRESLISPSQRLSFGINIHLSCFLINIKIHIAESCPTPGSKHCRRNA